MKDEFTEISVLSRESIEQAIDRFKYLHIGCVQVALKPLFREGLNVPVYLAFRDKRHLRFSHSILGIIQSNLERGPVYFMWKPGFIISLQDANLRDAISLDVHSQGLELKDGSLPFAVCYRVYFKLVHTIVSPRALGISPKGNTMLMEVNIEKSSMTVPKLLQWSELTQNLVWRIPGASTHVQNKEKMLRSESTIMEMLKFSSIQNQDIPRFMKL
ncbi:uncharacterized protein LOC120090856 [Benincasa hispida]|uniref:uncharacterized protein LOC120090856 n=1 Tax=Benincasa hispida TaxID=102211 RepID=UPI0019014DAC|nr:uncharacterized protein LOC120090856 [Benincasa hispida]